METVDEKILIGDLVRRYPEAAGILAGIGMHCLGCPASQKESLEEACAVHGVDPQALVKMITEIVGRCRS